MKWKQNKTKMGSNVRGNMAWEQKTSTPSFIHAISNIRRKQWKQFSAILHLWWQKRKSISIDEHKMSIRDSFFYFSNLDKLRSVVVCLSSVALDSWLTDAECRKRENSDIVCASDTMKKTNKHMYNHTLPDRLTKCIRNPALNSNNSTNSNNRKEAINSVGNKMPYVTLKIKCANPDMQSHQMQTGEQIMLEFVRRFRSNRKSSWWQVRYAKNFRSFSSLRKFLLWI